MFVPLLQSGVTKGSDLPHLIGSKIELIISEVNLECRRAMGLETVEKCKCLQAIFEIFISRKGQIDNFLELDTENDIVSTCFVRYEQVTGSVAQMIIDKLKNK